MSASALQPVWRQAAELTFPRRTFGKEGSPYNFAGAPMGEMKKKCQQLEEDQQSMRKKVNPKVLSMIDR